MAIQIPTSSELENAQRTVIAKTRFTAEHAAPCANLVDKITIGRGEKSVTLPKVGQMEADDLVAGVDITDFQDIGMSTAELTPNEVGLGILLHDKLVRQQNEDVFNIVGRQAGDAMGRKKDEKGIALFSGFSNTAGGAGKNLSFANWSGCAAIMKQLKAPPPIFCVHHPYAIHYLMKDVAQVGSYPISGGVSERLLKDFWSMTFDRIAVFHDGNIEPDALDDAVGAMFSKQAMTIVESLGLSSERERNASLRATELIVVADYGWYETEDSYGLAMTYDAATPTTNA